MARELPQGDAGLFKALMTFGSWLVLHNTLIYLEGCSNLFGWQLIGQDRGVKSIATPLAANRIL